MLGFKNAADYGRAREVLLQADYTPHGFADKLDREVVLSVAAADLPPWLRRTRDLTPLDALIRLFFLDVPVPEEAASRALAPMPVESWVDAGLVAIESSESRVAPQAKILPLGDLVFASDRPRLWTEKVRPDFVMAPGLTTVELAHATIRTPSNRSLDLGTGCGALGLLAAQHSRAVVLTDSNRRAVEFASFNARLNGFDHVECRMGNLFEPVAQERFDLIVSNPPFVISPTRRFQFRDAGMRGDEFCHQLVRAAPAYLAEGGYCQLKCNCVHRTGHNWQQDLAGWFRGLSCDVIVWVERVEDASDYAMTWIIGTESHDPALVPVLYEQWMQYFKEESIEAVSYLLVTLRRRDSQSHSVRIDDAPRRIKGPCGAELLRNFALRDSGCLSQNDDQLLDHRWRCAPDIRIQQQHAMTDAGMRSVGTQLQKTGGSQFVAHVPPQIAGFLARCDGARSVRDILAEMAEALDEDPTRMVGSMLPNIRGLADRGILVMEDDLGTAESAPS